MVEESTSSVPVPLLCLTSKICAEHYWSVDCCRIMTVTCYNKAQFAYESSVPSAVRADSYAEYKTKIHYRVSNCVVACSARALSLIGPPSPRSVGTTHSTIGLFRTPKCPHSTECRDGVENQQV